MLQLHLRDQQFYCLPKCAYIKWLTVATCVTESICLSEFSFHKPPSNAARFKFVFKLDSVHQYRSVSELSVILNALTRCTLLTHWNGNVLTTFFFFANGCPGRKSFYQIPVRLATEISSLWRHFQFSIVETPRRPILGVTCLQSVSYHSIELRQYGEVYVTQCFHMAEQNNSPGVDWIDNMRMSYTYCCTYQQLVCVCSSSILYF